MKQVIFSFIFLLLCACSSDEPSKELTISDLLYSTWNGKQTESSPEDGVRTIKNNVNPLRQSIWEKLN